VTGRRALRAAGGPGRHHASADLPRSGDRPAARDSGARRRGADRARGTPQRRARVPGGHRLRAGARPLSCPVGAHSEDGEVFALVPEVPWSEDWAVEALVSHQESRLRFQQPLSLLPIALPLAGELDVARGYVGVRRQWRRGRWAPFAGAGVGLADFRPTAASLLVPEELRGAHRAATLAAGLEVDLWERLGARLEARGHWTGLPESAGGDLVQSEIAIGLGYRP
jgi:hypothetical protein